MKIMKTTNKKLLQELRKVFIGEQIDTKLWGTIPKSILIGGGFGGSYRRTAQQPGWMKGKYVLEFQKDQYVMYVDHLNGQKRKAEVPYKNIKLVEIVTTNKGLNLVITIHDTMYEFKFPTLKRETLHNLAKFIELSKEDTLENSNKPPVNKELKAIDRYNTLYEKKLITRDEFLVLSKRLVAIKEKQLEAYENTGDSNNIFEPLPIVGE
jgi:hypothetical protein